MIRSKILSSMLKKDCIVKKLEKKLFKKYELENKDMFLIIFEGGYNLNEIMAKGELHLLSKKNINLKGLNIDISKNIYLLLLDKKYILMDLKLLNKLVIGKVYYFYKDNIYRIKLISDLNVKLKKKKKDENKKSKELRDDVEENQINNKTVQKSLINFYIICKSNMNIELIKIFLNFIILLRKFSISVSK